MLVFPTDLSQAVSHVRDGPETNVPATCPFPVTRVSVVTATHHVGPGSRNRQDPAAFVCGPSLTRPIARERLGGFVLRILHVCTQYAISIPQSNFMRTQLGVLLRSYCSVNRIL